MTEGRDARLLGGNPDDLAGKLRGDIEPVTGQPAIALVEDGGHLAEDPDGEGFTSGPGNLVDLKVLPVAHLEILHVVLELPAPAKA